MNGLVRKSFAYAFQPRHDAADCLEQSNNIHPPPTTITTTMMPPPGRRHPPVTIGGVSLLAMMETQDVDNTLLRRSKETTSTSGSSVLMNLDANSQRLDAADPFHRTRGSTKADTRKQSKTSTSLASTSLRNINNKKSTLAVSQKSQSQQQNHHRHDHTSMGGVLATLGSLSLEYEEEQESGYYCDDNHISNSNNRTLPKQQQLVQAFNNTRRRQPPTTALSLAKASAPVPPHPPRQFSRHKKTRTNKSTNKAPTNTTIRPKGGGGGDGSLVAVFAPRKEDDEDAILEQVPRIEIQPLSLSDNSSSRCQTRTTDGVTMKKRVVRKTGGTTAVGTTTHRNNPSRRTTCPSKTGLMAFLQDTDSNSFSQQPSLFPAKKKSQKPKPPPNQSVLLEDRDDAPSKPTRETNGRENRKIHKAKRALVNNNNKPKGTRQSQRLACNNDSSSDDPDTPDARRRRGRCTGISQKRRSSPLVHNYGSGGGGSSPALMQEEEAYTAWKRTDQKTSPPNLNNKNGGGNLGGSLNATNLFCKYNPKNLLFSQCYNNSSVLLSVQDHPPKISNNNIIELSLDHNDDDDEDSTVLEQLCVSGFDERSEKESGYHNDPPLVRRRVGLMSSDAPLGKKTTTDNNVCYDQVEVMEPPPRTNTAASVSQEVGQETDQTAAVIRIPVQANPFSAGGDGDDEISHLDENDVDSFKANPKQSNIPLGNSSGKHPAEIEIPRHLPLEESNSAMPSSSVIDLCSSGQEAEPSPATMEECSSSASSNSQKELLSEEEMNALRRSGRSRAQPDRFGSKPIKSAGRDARFANRQNAAPSRGRGTHTVSAQEDRCASDTDEAATDTPKSDSGMGYSSSESSTSTTQSGRNLAQPPEPDRHATIINSGQIDLRRSTRAAIQPDRYADSVSRRVHAWNPRALKAKPEMVGNSKSSCITTKLSAKPASHDWKVSANEKKAETSLAVAYSRVSESKTMSNKLKANSPSDEVDIPDAYCSPVSDEDEISGRKYPLRSQFGVEQKSATAPNNATNSSELPDPSNARNDDERMSDASSVESIQLRRHPRRRRGEPDRFGYYADLSEDGGSLNSSSQKIASPKTASKADPHSIPLERGRFVARKLPFANRQNVVHGLSQDGWSNFQLMQLKEAHSSVDPTSVAFWNRVAMSVDNKSSIECRDKWFALVATPKPKVAAKEKKVANKQIREPEPMDDEDDLFNATPFRAKLPPTHQQPLMEHMDLGSAIKMDDTAVANADMCHGDMNGANRLGVGYKSYLNGLKREIARPKKKGSKKPPGLPLKSRAITEACNDGDADLNARLSPGGTLHLKNLGSCEDDFWDEMYDIDGEDEI